MTTRCYFSASVAAPVTPTFGGGSANTYQSTSGAIRQKLLHASSTETLTSGPTVAITGLGSNHLYLSAQFVSDSLAAQTISHTGNFTSIIAWQNDQGGLATVSGYAKIYVVSADGSTVRGFLWDGAATSTGVYGSNTSTTFFSKHDTTNPTPFTAGADLVTTAGDRIVVELGYSGDGANGTNHVIQQYGASSAADYTANGQSAENPWIQFSQTLTFLSVTTGSITSAEATALTNDRPLWMANNILEAYNALGTWRRNLTLVGTSDITDSNYPSRRAINRLANAGTSPVDQGAGVQNYYLIFSLVPGTDGLHTNDALWIAGHNLGSLDGYARNHGGALSVSWILAADNGFGTTVTPYTNNGPFDNRRIFTLFANRYTTINYAALQITTTAADFGGMVPNIGEIIAGRRRQMAYRWDRPYDQMGAEADYVEVVPKSRTAVRYGLHDGGRDFDMTWVFGAGGDANGLVQETEARSMWVECNHGRKPVVFCPNPSTHPGLAYLEMIKQKDLKIPYVDAGTVSMTLNTYEVAPFVLTENEALYGYPVGTVV